MSKLQYLAFLFALACAPLASADDIESLSDEFDDASSLARWRNFDAEFGWPDRIRQLDVDESTAGALSLQPFHSAWVRDRNAAFLFRDVMGDFDVRARVRVRGKASEQPGGTWSLAGLMARVPNRSTERDWEPRRENWHFITTGIAAEKGKVVTETKGTYNSYSSLKLRPFVSGWVELRLVKVGMMMFALARPDGAQEWQLRDRWYRMEGRPQMQVGVIAYTTSDDRPDEPENPETQNRTVEPGLATDMIFDVDWIRFARPKATSPNDWLGQVARHPLADTSVSDAEVLRALGD